MQFDCITIHESLGLFMLLAVRILESVPPQAYVPSHTHMSEAMQHHCINGGLHKAVWNCTIEVPCLWFCLPHADVGQIFAGNTVYVEIRVHGMIDCNEELDNHRRASNCCSSLRLLPHKQTAKTQPPHCSSAAGSASTVGSSTGPSSSLTSSSPPQLHLQVQQYGLHMNPASAHSKPFFIIAQSPPDRTAVIPAMIGSMIGPRRSLLMFRGSFAIFRERARCLWPSRAGSSSSSSPVTFVC